MKYHWSFRTSGESKASGSFVAIITELAPLPFVKSRIFENICNRSSIDIVVIVVMKIIYECCCVCTQRACFYLVRMESAVECNISSKSFKTQYQCYIGGSDFNSIFLQYFIKNVLWYYFMIYRPV